MLQRIANWLITRRAADHITPYGMLWLLFNNRYIGLGVSLLTDNPSGDTNIHPHSGASIVLSGAVVRHSRGDRQKRGPRDYVYTDDEGRWLCWTQGVGETNVWIKGQAHKWELQSPAKYEERILDLPWMDPTTVRTDTQRQAVLLMFLFSKTGDLP
jgi:hypothetical protein